jgi:hypothetical protein
MRARANAVSAEGGELKQLTLQLGKPEAFRLEPSPDQVILCRECGQQTMVIKRGEQEVVTIRLKCKCGKGKHDSKGRRAAHTIG